MRVFYPSFFLQNQKKRENPPFNAVLRKKEKIPHIKNGGIVRKLFDREKSNLFDKE
jgi:hypothetical protein